MIDISQVSEAADRQTVAYRPRDEGVENPNGAPQSRSISFHAAMAAGRHLLTDSTSRMTCTVCGSDHPERSSCEVPVRR